MIRKQLHWPGTVWSLRRRNMGRVYARTLPGGDIMLLDGEYRSANGNIVGQVFVIKKEDARLWARRINQIRDKQTERK